MKEVTKIGVWSLAKFLGGLYALLGFIFGAFLALISLSLFRSVPEGSFGLGSLFLGLGFFSVLVFPVAGGIMGLVVGVIWALLYNLVAHFIGGVKVDLEDEGILQGEF